MTESTSDVELLERWQAGDRRAGSLLFRRHFARVFAFFSVRTRSDAGDLVQRTFLACVESQQRLAAADDFSRYLMGICRKVLLMHLRSRSREQRVSLRSSPERELSAPRSGALEWVGAREHDRRLARALDRLGTDEQLALRLYYWEDCSVATIAELFGISRATVKFRLFRARRRLMAVLAHIADDTGSYEPTRRSAPP